MALKQILGGDASGAVKAVEDLNRAVNKNEKAWKDSAKGATQAERAAKRIAEQVDPQRRYNRQIGELADLVNRGRLSLNQAEDAAKRYRNRLDQAGRSGKEAFGAAAISRLASYAAGFVSLSAATNLARQALHDLAAEREAARQRDIQGRFGQGSLAQLAATAQDPKKRFAQLLKESRAIFAGGSFESLDESGNTLFSLISAGLEKRDRDFAIKLRQQGVIRDIGPAAAAAAALRSSLGRQEIGSFRDLISKALQASEVAPAQANEIIQASARSGGSAKALGLTDEFVLAATAILARQTGTAEQGGTQLSSLLKGIEQKSAEQFKGKTGVQIVEEFKRIGVDNAATLKDLIGQRKEATQAIRALVGNLDEFRGLVEKVSTASQRRVAETALGLPQTDIRLASAQAADTAKRTQEESFAEQRAGIENIYETIVERQRRLAREEQPGWLGDLNAVLARWDANLNELFGLQRIATRQLAERGELTPEERQLWERSIAASERSADATEQRSAPTGREE